MEPIEKIERLRESANVTFEEARIALEDSNWDLLDAMVSLEEAGKTVTPIRSTKSTETEIPPLPSVKQVVEDNQQKYVKEDEFSEKMKRGFKKIGQFLKNNSFRITRENKEVFSIPLFALLIIILVSWQVVLILAIVGLFFNLRYSFTGKNNLKTANDFMDKAGQAADKVKEEFKKI